MAELKIKVELEKGRVGVHLDLLAKVATEARKFLDMFARDVDLGDGDWIANRFTNNSVAYDANFIGETGSMEIAVAQNALRHITDPDRTPDDLGFGISRETFFQMGKMASHLPVNEVMFIGLYDRDENTPEMRPLTRARFEEIERLIVERTSHYGGVQGHIIALFKSVNTIWLHDISTRSKVVCKFEAEKYNDVWELLKQKDAIVSVEGWITDRPGRESHLKIASIRAANEYQEGDLEKFFGLDPEITGELSTSEYLDLIRGDTEEMLMQAPDEQDPHIH